jgi:signal transduction histidine kinase
MSPVVLILAVLLLAALAAALVLWRQTQSLKRAMAELGEEARKAAGSQAQVIHTTKLASLGQMVAGVAHELNTPLGFVKSNVEVVAELLAEYKSLQEKVIGNLRMASAFAPTDPRLPKLPAILGQVAAKLAEDVRLAEADELLKDSADGLDQLAKLVRNLKGFARVDQDGMDLLDVNDSVESALTIAGHELRDRIVVNKELSNVPKVKVVASQINQVFLNLITNAAQAMRDSGTLTIRTRRAGDMVEVDVEDTGAGISPEVLSKIFDPFFTTKPVGEGTGLGLSIVHKIIKGHDGGINVRSQPNKGSTFTVSLPVDHASLRTHSRSDRVSESDSTAESH